MKEERKNVNTAGDAWEPLAFHYQVIGRFTLGLIYLVVELPIAWVLGKLIDVTYLPLGRLTQYIVVSTVICAVCNASLMRHWCIKERRDLPTGKAEIFAEIVATAVATWAVGYWLADTWQQQLAMSALLALAVLADRLIFAPDAGTPDDVRDKVAQSHVVLQNMAADIKKDRRNQAAQRLDQFNKEHGVNRLGWHPSSVDEDNDQQEVSEAKDISHEAGDDGGEHDI
ncbi:hypothetical protein KIMH_07760 [Bombiscardovia apis]|uniref:Transmembrane protein n=1 Tax=Bombiscardovia apis TaxID=2932182 RepID=A0ABM8BCQ6_9BIFI|nr:hypothetical protein [Bombiscardovia apis]BDR54665.1 hypothetical protein KIMH_07760 [Bombiscardovia apis]